MLDKSGIKKMLVGLLTGAMLILPTLSYADWGRHEDHHYYRYHDRPAFGLHLSFVPDEAVLVSAGGMRYYYYDGLYYNRIGSEYVVVAPPIGVMVSAIPPDFRPVRINGVTYYTDSGVYYVYTRYGYRVVNSPVIQTYAQPVVVSQPAQVITVPQNQTKVVEGAGLGGILGALIGGIVGHQEKGHHTASGALIGGVTGAAAGGIIGAQIPNQNAAPAVVVSQPAAVAAPPAAVLPASTSPQANTNGTYPVNIANSQGGFTTVIIKRSGNGYVGPQGEYYADFPKVSQLQAMYSK